MFYIHHTSCVSPQQTFGDIDFHTLREPVDSKLLALEPTLADIPAGLLRRMGKAIRLGVGAGLALLKVQKVDGIIIGTSNGGLEDCVKFLAQIIEYEEGRLTPTNFVQSTPNAIAAQLGLMSENKGYNITHTHRGLAFENALLDASMMLHEHPDNTYLLGGIDEISSYNYAIEKLGNWYKEQPISNTKLYEDKSPGTLAGEGAAMFLIDKKPAGSMGKMRDMLLLHSNKQGEITQKLKQFLFINLKEEETIDLLISGENGDCRHLPYYQAVENELPQQTSIVRYKHLCGEYPTSSAFALWLATHMFQEKSIPTHLYKQKGSRQNKLTLIYTHYKGEQHSFILLSNN